MQVDNLLARQKTLRVDTSGRYEEVSPPTPPLEKIGSHDRASSAVVKGNEERRLARRRPKPRVRNADRRTAGSTNRIQMRVEGVRGQLITGWRVARKPAGVKVPASDDVMVYPVRERAFCLRIASRFQRRYRVSGG